MSDTNNEYKIFSWWKIPLEIFDEIYNDFINNQCPSMEIIEMRTQYWYTEQTVKNILFECVCIADQDFVEKKLMWN